jgi:membrane associated rhomboid family serine protease
MKKVFVIGLLCLSQTGCLAITAVGLVTDVAVAIVKVPIKVGGAVGGAMISLVMTILVLRQNQTLMTPRSWNSGV